ncbi:MAG: hypothetical protein KJ905_03050 [Nanoarchaeota archaeon]|nr:hypothetical protein [Nanoarchaeota archaeon]MBU1501726.1 hypothetical protein [Nanoarchaeota archaeon]MBU2459254.1 hypothetical protein [Nanoarchaeota archaeon]
MKKRGEVQTWVLILIVFFLIVAVYFLTTKTWNITDEKTDLQKCVGECSELKTELSLINPGSEEYLNQEEKIINKSEECLVINEKSDSSISETEILGSCGISKTNTNCVASGETIYLLELETCAEGIQKCCSERGLCVTNKSHVQNYVACVPY